MVSVDEEWKAVVGWEDYYEVSNQGRVRSISRWVETRRGRRWHEGVVRSPGVSKRGVRGLYLSRKVKGVQQKKYYAVHTLVVLAFIGPSPNPSKNEVNHIDGNRANNTVNNLEWVTPKENTDHAVRLGLRPYGDRHGRAVVNSKEVMEIRQKYADGRSCNSLAKEYGISTTTCDNIVKRVTWKSVG